MIGWLFDLCLSVILWIVFIRLLILGFAGYSDCLRVGFGGFVCGCFGWFCLVGGVAGRCPAAFVFCFGLFVLLLGALRCV